MFHHDPPPGEGPVRADILGRAVLAPRFAPRRRPQASRVEFVDAHIRQIAQAPDPLWQPLQQLGLLQQLDVDMSPINWSSSNVRIL